MPRGQKSAVTFPPIGHRSSAAGDCASCVGELLPDSAVSRNHFVKSFTLKMSSCPGICSGHFLIDGGASTPELAFKTET